MIIDLYTWVPGIITRTVLRINFAVFAIEFILYKALKSPNVELI